MEKIKVYSPVLGKEVSFETNSLDGPKHSSIEEFFYSMTNCHIKRNFLKMELDHAVVEATVWSDNPPRTVTAIGEATALSLTNDIAKANPVITADNRAFDRAVLKYLGLNNIYAASENVKQENLKALIESDAPISISEPIPEEPSVPSIGSFEDYAADNIAELSDEEEFKKLSKEKCLLRSYKSKDGTDGYPPHGWILKHHPNDITQMIRIASKMNPEEIKYTDPERAEILIKFNRFIELGKKLGHIH